MSVLGLSRVLEEMRGAQNATIKQFGDRIEAELEGVKLTEEESGQSGQDTEPEQEPNHELNKKPPVFERFQPESPTKPAEQA